MYNAVCSIALLGLLLGLILFGPALTDYLVSKDDPNQDRSDGPDRG